jgi:RND family efflux transporter MFP subunit
MRSSRRAACLFLAFGTTVAAAPNEGRSVRGITEPLNDATISAIVPGRVAVIRKKEGEAVAKGDVVLEMEKEEQELEAARRKLISESKVEVDSAKHQADTLKLDYTATKQLFDTTQSVSEEELWKKELDYKLAVAEYDKLQIAEKREELEWKIAEEQLKERVVFAPFDGTVVKIHKHTGDSANAQDPLVRVVDVHQCRFIAYVEAASAPHLAKGSKVSLRIGEGGSAVSRTGTIEYMSPVVDPSSGLREVKALFDNSDGKVQPGVSGVMILEGKK